MLNSPLIHIIKSRFFLGLFSLLSLFITTTASAAIVNNNNLYQVSEVLNDKVLALAKAKNSSIDAVEVPIFSDQLPIHLYSKSLDIYDQVARLEEDKKFLDKDFPNKVLRSADVMDLLTEVDDALNVSLQAAKVDPTAFARDKPLGKHSGDVFRQLWLLSYRLSTLAPPPGKEDSMSQIVRIEKEVRLVAKAKGLKVADLASPAFEKKTERDVVLVLYQNMHLLGRLQRQLGTEAISPGLPHSGKIHLADIYDSSRTILADIHRMKTSLSIDEVTSKPEKPASVSLDDLYSQAHVIHDLLLNLTGSEL